MIIGPLLGQGLHTCLAIRAWDRHMTADINEETDNPECYEACQSEFHQVCYLNMPPLCYPRLTLPQDPFPSQLPSSNSSVVPWMTPDSTSPASSPTNSFFTPSLPPSTQTSPETDLQSLPPHDLFTQNHPNPNSPPSNIATSSRSLIT